MYIALFKSSKQRESFGLQCITDNVSLNQRRKFTVGIMLHYPERAKKLTIVDVDIDSNWMIDYNSAGGESLVYVSFTPVVERYNFVKLNKERGKSIWLKQ